MPKTPPVETLKAFTRSTDNVDSPVIFYPELDSYADLAREKERPIWNEFWSAEDNSIDEEDRARAAAMGYFVLTGEQMQRAAEHHRPDVARRFTEAAVELYGQPDVEEVRRLATEQYHYFDGLLGFPGIDHIRLTRVLSFLKKQLGEVTAKSEQSPDDLAEARQAVREAFEARFGNALSVFDDLDMSQKNVPVEEIARLFGEAKNVLAETDPAWNGEKIVLSDKKSMGYDNKKHEIQIGKKGSYGPKRMKRLFIEEALVHAQRTMNGAKTGDETIEHGLPGYLASEEGLAKFVQVSMGEELGEKSVDFYVDTSFALGQLGQEPVSRPELVDFYVDKMVVRQQAQQNEIDMDKLYDDAWRYANRIYRGSLGNEHIGVNTKDIAYYQGYLIIGNYIKQELDRGIEAGELLDYLLSGRFDPTNQRHVASIGQFVETPLVASLQ